jgi:hypothetical protein
MGTPSGKRAFAAALVVLGAGTASASAATWAQVVYPSAHAGASIWLGSVACSSSNSCEAVGQLDTHNVAPIAEHWNGSHWTAQATPVPPHSGNGFLGDVMCSSPTACTAVGGYVSHGHERPLIERWHGSHWTVVSSPDPAAAHLPGPVNSHDSRLESVSCGSAAACIAVGQYGFGNGFDGWPLVERWNGSHWSIVATPRPAGANEAALGSVSCPSPYACTAVGSVDGGAGTLAERWNGSHWSIQSTPNGASSSRNALFGVSCRTSSTCEAVGASPVNTVSDNPLALRWNAAAWSAQPTTTPAGASSADLVSVSCPNAGACEAIGKYVEASSGDSGPLAGLWNGSAWSLTLLPVVPRGQFAQGQLGSISCTSASWCLAVGDRLAERFS